MIRWSASPEDLVAALAGTSRTLVTLPSRTRCPHELVAAVEEFEAGDRPAALASAKWLREHALDEHGSARTYVFVAENRALAFFAVGRCCLPGAGRPGRSGRRATAAPCRTARSGGSTT